LNWRHISGLSRGWHLQSYPRSNTVQAGVEPESITLQIVSQGFTVSKEKSLE
jgi:hypothetical protein